MDLGWVAFGVLLLYVGGETLVDNAVALARVLGLSPLVIGLTVVAFGTSAPELAATLTAALKGTPEVAFGNVVGSNIANLGLVLGIAALIAPLPATARFLRRELPFMIGASGLMIGLLLDGQLGRLEGAILLALLVAYVVYLLRRDRETAKVEAEFAEEFGGGRPRLLRSILGVGLGIALLVFGADRLVTGAVGLARAFGVGERVIGLTLVALGTSLPELASTIVAAVKGEGDLVLGNLIGSNVFNILAILGTTALVRPLYVDTVSVGARADMGVMLVLSLLVWPFMYSHLRLDRWEGAVLLAAYAAYLGWLFI